MSKLTSTVPHQQVIFESSNQRKCQILVKVKQQNMKRNNSKQKERSMRKIQAVESSSKLMELVQIQIPVNLAVALVFLAAAAPLIWEYIYNNFLTPIRCKVCYGGGALICQQCQGRGKTGGWVVEETLSECKNCEGRGKNKCGECKGTGLWNNWLYAPSSDPGWGPRGNK
eukprot:TRINITY_DN7832_c0_g1_i3.p2 TRINITY_DN7832_c0_g1~~TRINITY_DN7832_c0_g1_i3.p2  ORF type:complete len:170 (-),score=19.71 TRINITY_DN7832_c0_g1_i3:693-1202(-)